MTDKLPIELIIVRKREVKKVYENLAYTKNMIAAVKASNFVSNEFTVMAESEEAANAVIDSQMGDILAKYGDKNLLELHITDQHAYNKYNLTIRVQLQVENLAERM